MIEEKVGKRIKELRNKLGISQEELGFRSGVHRNIYCKFGGWKTKCFHFHFGKDCHCSQCIIE